MLIFAFDGDEFGYWDADSVASNRPGQGFGNLFYVDKLFTSVSQFGNLYANGRFTTAGFKEKWLEIVDSSFGGHFESEASKHEKRYQVISLQKR